MGELQIGLQASKKPTSIRLRITNLSQESVYISAPDPYSSIFIFDKAHQPYPRVRAIAYEHSRKSCQLLPSQECFATIDLLHYWDEICGEVRLQIRLETTTGSGVSHDYIVEGNVFLNIPSYQEKYLEMKRRPRPGTGTPIKLFDVSDSTTFEQVDCPSQ